MTSLKEQIQINRDFRNSINLYLDLNKEEKVKGFIPTNSSVKILDTYLKAVEEKQQKATMLIGPYGKGKSHLLLVLLAVLSMEKNAENKKKLRAIVKKIKDINQSAAQRMERLIRQGERYLPVLISNTQENLNESFLYALAEALKRDGLSNLVPDSYYSHAIERILCWEKEYPKTYEMYEREVESHGISVEKLMDGLKNGQKEMLSIFREIYPKLTAGASFHPMIHTDAMKLYENVAHILKEDYGYCGIYIVFDEFSKYIESQDKKNAGSQMKLLQDMCELSNTSKDGDIFITLVAHKGMKEYGSNLSTQMINSFTGIEGRIKEIYFITSSKNNYELVKNAICKKEKTIWKEPKIQKYLGSETAGKYYELPAFSSHFTREEFEKTVLKGCYPLSPISAYLLLNVSEKVAQNERTVFTFLSKDEENTMVDFIENVGEEEEWVVFADRIYDYFSILFKKEAANERIHNEWLNAEYAISLAENKAQERILKTLAVINIVNKKEELGTRLKELFLASGVEETEEELERLLWRNVLFQRRTDESYAFKTRATSKLRREIQKRREKREGRINIGEIMLLVSEEKYILPRKYNREQKMTRYFPCEYMEVSRFLAIPELEVLVQDEACDGKVIYLYTQEEKDYEEELSEKLKDMPEQMVVVYGRHPLAIVSQMEEYRVVLDLKADTDYWKQGEHMLLRKELPLMEEDLEKEIVSCMEEMYGEHADKTVFYSKKEHIKSVLIKEKQKKLDEIVDEICGVLYEKSICINNELINKKCIKTSPIKKVQKNLIEMLLNDRDMTPYLNGTSADATIYRALFVETGLHKMENGETKETDANIQGMLSVYYEFFNRSEESGEKLPMKELIRTLTGAPIGMRRGIIPIFLAYAIKESKKSIIVYFGGKEKPLTEEIVVNMCEEAEDYSIFISREDERKKVYLKKMQDIFQTGPVEGNQAVKTGKLLQAMKNWMNGLPQVTKNLKDVEYFQGAEHLGAEQYVRLLPKFKRKITDIEANPFEVVFLELPKIFGMEESEAPQERYEILVLRIQELKERLDAYFLELQKKTIKAIKEIFGSDRELIPLLKAWHDEQSPAAGQGMGSPKLSKFMSCIGKDDNFDESTLLRKMARILTGVTMDSWNENSLEEFSTGLKEIKEEAERIGKKEDGGQRKLSFTGKNGETIVRYYNEIPAGYEDTLKEMLRSDLEDFSDLPLNDRIALVLEVIEEMME